MTVFRCPLDRWLPLIREGEPAPALERHDRVAIGRELRERHDVIVLWRRDLNPMQLATADTIAGQVLGGQKR